jgi:hypothetical protein
MWEINLHKSIKKKWYWKYKLVKARIGMAMVLKTWYEREKDNEDEWKKTIWCKSKSQIRHMERKTFIKKDLIWINFFFLKVWFEYFYS